jgi:phosphoglycolate phosphatase-like HAD superfamily hydrolase
MVGDGLTDVLAGRAAGARTILVSARKCYLCEEIAKYDATPDFLAANLVAAVDIIRAQQDQPSTMLRSLTR